MIIREGKEIKLCFNEEKNFNYKLGTFSKKNPKALYIIGSTWLTPYKESDNYELVIKDVSKIFDNTIKKILIDNHLFERNYISEINTHSNRIKLNKKSFLSFEIHLKQKNILKLKDNILMNNIMNFNLEIENILTKELNKHFKLSKTKK